MRTLLDKIGAGAKFLAEHIWGALKSVFGSQKAKDISLAALQAAKDLLETEVGQFIEKLVTELEASALEGPARLAQATSSIQSYLSQQGKEMPVVWIHWAIETILLFLRGLAKDDAPPVTE
jgi:hypothetical protein